MKFDWDERKNQANIREHKVSFEEASTIFFNEVTEIPDLEHSDDFEHRFIAFGMSALLRELFVCYCYKELINGDEVIRIITARKANQSERREFFNER